MRNKNRFTLSLLVLILLSLLLGGCDDLDQELFYDIVLAWVGDDGSADNLELKVVGIVTGVWEQTAKEFVSAEEAIQLNGLDVIDDIERADELSKEGLTPENEHLMAEAIELRPEDWRIRERDAVLWIMNGNSAATASAEDKSDSLLKNQIKNPDNCPSLRLQQLRYREQTYQENYKNCQMEANCNFAEYEAAHVSVQQEIKEILNTGQSPFCGN